MKTSSTVSHNGDQKQVLACLTLMACVGSALSADAEQSRSEIAFFDETTAITLFAFDDVSIPFSQNLKLVMRSPERHPANPVVRRGEAGSPDSWAVQFYGSVLREGDKFRMWYVAAGSDRLNPAVPRSAPCGLGVSGS